MEAEPAAAAPRTPNPPRRRRDGGEHEPTNAEPLDFMRGMQASSEHKFQDIAERMGRGEKC